MFEKKKKSLFEIKKSDKQSTSSFVEAALMESNFTKSANGSVKLKSTLNDFVDQFGKVSQYRQIRAYKEIAADMQLLYSQEPLTAVRFAVYLRLISRKTILGGQQMENIQKGAGLKHESIMRFMWLAINHKSVFLKNMDVFIAAGSWHDFFTMLQYDLVYNGWDNRKLDWDAMKSFLLLQMKTGQVDSLLLKYMPRIQSKSKCTTVESQANSMIGKWLCSFLFDGDKIQNYKAYRQLKSSGKAHEWQKLISQKKFTKINFSTISGRALNQIVKSKFLKNHGLEKSYLKWLDSKPVVNFTGYPHELFAGYHQNFDAAKKKTINKQFLKLVENLDEDCNMIVVRDTSGSMSSRAQGTNCSSGDIAKALALYFSYGLKGAFQDSWIEFNSNAKMHQWKGKNPVDRWENDRSNYIGSTDFQSVIDLFCNMRSRKQVPESEFPKGIICISDGEFDPSSLNETNVESARRKLSAHFSKEYAESFKIVLWNIPNSYCRGNSKVAFETKATAQNTFYFSGYDGSVISFLMGNITEMPGQKESGAPKNAIELFKTAMNQDLLKIIEI